jgi:N-methylhydantoinase A
MYQYGKSDHIVVPADTNRVNEVFSGLTAKAFSDLGNAGFDKNDITAIRSLDMRYRYQVHEVNVPLPSGVSQLRCEDMDEVYDRFDDLYESLYGKGSAYREAGKEIVTFRVTAIGALRKPNIRRGRRAALDGVSALKGTRPVYFEEDRDFIPTSIYDFERMCPGMNIGGPAVIESPVTTIVINPKDRATIDDLLNVRISVGT